MLTWRIWIFCPQLPQPRFRARDLHALLRLRDSIYVGGGYLRSLLVSQESRARSRFHIRIYVTVPGFVCAVVKFKKHKYEFICEGNCGLNRWQVWARMYIFLSKILYTNQKLVLTWNIQITVACGWVDILLMFLF